MKHLLPSLKNVLPNSKATRSELHVWLKWIVCEVEETQRLAFSAAQEQWSSMLGQSGLVGQFGGWDRVPLEGQQASRAGVLGLWENQKSLEAFMAPQGLHDQIYAANQQGATMRSCKVSLFHELFPMAGAFPSLRAAAREATWLRVASCRVSDAAYLSFLEAQRQIWLPGMRAAPGMLGGSFAGDGSDGFLVVTLWKSEDDHAHYRREILPSLRKQVMTMGGFPDSLLGFSIRLEPRWNIL